MKKLLLAASGIFLATSIYIGVNTHKNINSVGDLLLSNVEALTQTGEADMCARIWTVTYSGSVGTSTGIGVSCTTGGEYKCPLCFWD